MMSTQPSDITSDAPGSRMSFEELERLQRSLDSLRARHAESLSQYYNTKNGGFWHKYNERDEKDWSKASTATCVLSLTSAGLWRKDFPWYAKTKELAGLLLHVDDWTSSKLPQNNPFTVSFLLEAALALQDVSSADVMTGNNQEQMEWAARRLNTVLLQDASAITRTTKKADVEELTGAVRGSAHIAPYPPTTFLTQLAVRVLQRNGPLDSKTQQAVKEWSWRQVEHELALTYSKSKTADPLALAYAAMVFVSVAGAADFTPVQNQILRRAIDSVFEAQLPDGSWPRSRPLFHYQNFGNAYCYEYEMLTQLLQRAELIEHFLRQLPGLKRATEYLENTAFDLGGKGVGWASGHHPHLQGPESWSTASVYHFLHLLDRVLAEALRRVVFEYVEAPYPAPKAPCANPEEFAPTDTFLDATLPGGSDNSLRKTIFDRFVSPVVKDIGILKRGLPRTKGPMSLLLFGPPGTSKTELARYISQYLGWPLLSIDPSHLIRDGWDRIHAETNKLFNRLAAIDQTVVFLDEFDEMVRERQEKGSEPLSRFFTTAMLPKLTLINQRRRIVLIVATNHVEAFDSAILRRGRFDLVIQVMLPTVDEKYRRWPEVKANLQQADAITPEVEAKLAAFTFAEFKEHAASFALSGTPLELVQRITDAHATCTLNTAISAEDTTLWSDVCRKQAEKYIRILKN